MLFGGEGGTKARPVVGEVWKSLPQVGRETSWPEY